MTRPTSLPRDSCHCLVIEVPPAPPWRQARAANLQLPLRAPLPIAELAWVIKRLRPWRPGISARFGVCFVHKAQLDAAPGNAAIFQAPDGTRYRFRKSGAAHAATPWLEALAAACALGCLGWAIGLVWTDQQSLAQSAKARLDQARAQLTQARAVAEVRRVEGRLAHLGVDPDRLPQALSIMAWMGEALPPGARLDALDSDPEATQITALVRDPTLALFALEKTPGPALAQAGEPQPEGSYTRVIWEVVPQNVERSGRRRQAPPPVSTLPPTVSAQLEPRS